MDVKILSKRSSTPGYLKVIGTLLFPAVFILMLVLPVFEMIPEDQYINVFNNQGVATGTYSSTQYTMFTMLENDYHTGTVMAIFMDVAILSALCGLFFLWVNRAKLAAIPASLLLAEVIFSVFRSPAKLYTSAEYFSANGLSTDGAEGFVHRYTNGDPTIFHRFGQYWLLWICAFVLLAVVIWAIIASKTLIEKKK